MPDNTAEIARLRGILNSGQSSYNVDGQSVTYDLDQIRKRLQELIATDTSGAETVKRPRVSRIKLDSF
jgi:hypothetical protein